MDLSILLLGRRLSLRACELVSYSALCVLGTLAVPHMCCEPSFHLWFSGFLYLQDLLACLVVVLRACTQRRAQDQGVGRELPPQTVNFIISRGKPEASWAFCGSQDSLGLSLQTHYLRV